MLNMKEFKGNPANMANLSLKHDEGSYSSSWRAPKSSEKFLYSASLLPAGEFLAWQIDTKTFSNVLFSGLDGKVTMKDYDWIFEECATTSPLTSEWMEDLYTEDRKVYMLSSVIDSTRDVKFDLSDDGRHGRRVREVFSDLLEMMTETGAVIRLIAGASGHTKGHGMIFISLPDELTLRMRSMLFVAFPHLEAVEVDQSSEETDEMAYLSDDCFLESMQRLLSALMRRKDGKELADGIEPEETKESEGKIEDDLENNPDDEEDGDFTDIDELELSVRSYNCLKRAGITTVEELRRLDDDDLMQVRNLSKKCMEEVKQKLAAFQAPPKTAPLQDTNYMAKLDELIGLTDVKEQVRKIVAFTKMKQDMSESGKANISANLNMGFVGNPGTAKTTVARIVAGIFYEIGLLPDSELIEVGRADLVAEYVGQTAVKVKDVFERAKGKVLFIDEAYSLVDGWSGSYGDEAINTIVQEMENNREDTIVIFAGYPDEMESFFSRNPGLRSRVPFMINFSDYSVEEMAKIAELEAKKRGFSIDSKASEKVTAICLTAALRSDMGNGRFCRNLIENAILGYASRVYGSDAADGKNCILVAEDFTSPTGVNDTAKMPIGFHAVT